jgi:predicted transcriptional regulator
LRLRQKRYAFVDLETIQRYGWIDVRLERSPGQVAPIYLNVLAIPVLVIPALTIPALSIPFLNGAQ